MIKKISAIALALVICLSIVVMPVNAAKVELGDNDIAFALEWDKKSYKGGDTAVLRVYMDAKDDLSLFTGSFAIGLNSNVINTTDNPIATVKANATTADWFRAYYKGADTQLSYLNNATVLNRFTGFNTAEENELYDYYIKYTAAKDTAAGTHANTGDNTQGFGGDEFNPDEPIITIKFTIAADVPAGTVVRAAITSGTTQATAATYVQTKWKYYANPGSASTTSDIAATTVANGLTNADTTVANGGTNVTIGAAGLAVSYWKDQIRFQADNAGAYAGKFDYRMLATIDGFADIFEDVADAKDTSDNDGILEAGFIFSKSGTVDKDAAIAQINGEGEATYSAVTNAYVSTSFGGKEYVMACYVGDIADADVDTALSALGYVKYMVDGETKVATFDAAQTSTFRTLYDKNASNKPA